MRKPYSASPEFLEFLGRTDTCTVSNAIEMFDVRMRNEGYVQSGSECLFPGLGPVAGYAVTARMRSSGPPISGICYYQRFEWWEHVASIPGPKIIVVQDVDHVPGIGALFGEIHARISKALGCVAYVTNGTIRDLEQVEALRFPCFARGTSVSHAYAHIAEFGEPVMLGGLKIATGDLLHADRNGVHSVPASVFDRLPHAVREIQGKEAELMELCESPDFTLRKLETALARAREWGPLPPKFR